MKLRVFFAPHIEMEMKEAVNLRNNYVSDKLKFIGLKGFVDGTPLGHTGYMVEPYSDMQGFRSEPLMKKEWLDEKSKECYKNDIAIRLHACGDGAVRMALDAYDKARKELGAKDVRNTIEHIEVLNCDDIKRFAETNTVASIQPTHMLMGSLEEHPIFAMIGAKRAELAWPGRSLAENGAVVAFGTDYPIVDMNPADTLYSAVKRRMENNLPEEGWNPREKFSMAEAIQNSTIGPAYMMHMEDKLGTLEEGKLADINVFNMNIFENEDELPSAGTDMTVFNGEIVYNKISD